MKKQIMSKRGRHFDEGGEVQNMPRARTAEEDQESADKSAGLEASNKEKSMGFFERLRAGNIDDPTSEAYKRFGAGRGRADRVPVVDVMPTPVEAAPAITNKSEGMKAFNQKLQATKNAEAEGAKITEGESIAKAMASKPDRVSSPRPSVSARPASKPAKKEYDPTAGEAKDKTAQAAADNITNPNIVTPATKPVAYKKNATSATAGKNYQNKTAIKDKEKNAYKKNATYSSSGKNYTPVNLKHGGSVSSRADGIAQRGKTRGKMC